MSATEADHAPMPGAERLAEPMRSRWSPTVFDPTQELAAEEVTVLLQAARWAPSNGNSQPWGFLVLPRGGAAHGRFLPYLSRGNSGWVPRAALLLVGGAQVAPDEEGEDVPDPDVARYDLGQAAAHLTLQAHATGLHAHQFAGFDKAGAAAEFAVPGHVQLLAGIAVGRRGRTEDAEEPDRARERRQRRRRPLEETAYGERWGVAWRG